ncbi:sensor histidine kinase [Sphaerisporangium corydalis]|uniref:histidine kinase n=1 Tax=Sphaerisporangium corydalis TaxID=1441875 RepID=A0ABV9ER25_9ACTN|nr:ATP-binding protein [Sphaerisporangium corydalis]
MEVFLGFRDAAGDDMRLELYLPEDQGGTTRRAVLVLLPMPLIGLVLLTLASAPLSMALARRMERTRAEGRAARDYGLAATELTRRDLARRLHDGVIPDLAGVGLLLQRARLTGGRRRETHAVTPDADPLGRAQDLPDADPLGHAQNLPDPDLLGHAQNLPDADLLGRAQDLLATDLRELRALLTELLPADPVGRDLGARLADLASHVRRSEDSGTVPAVHIDAIEDVPGGPALVLYRVAGELLRNAFRHARARTIRVGVTAQDVGGVAMIELTVTDDGTGFDPRHDPGSGHVGLRLVRRVVDDGGGRLTMVSAPGAGTTATVSVPRATAHPHH